VTASAAGAASSLRQPPIPPAFLPFMCTVLRAR
jgi:hypothetical protein